MFSSSIKSKRSWFRRVCVCFFVRLCLWKRTQSQLDRRRNSEWAGVICTVIQLAHSASAHKHSCCSNHSSWYSRERTSVARQYLRNRAFYYCLFAEHSTSMEIHFGHVSAFERRNRKMYLFKVEWRSDGDDGLCCCGRYKRKIAQNHLLTKIFSF